MPAAVPKRGRGTRGGGTKGLRFFLESRKKQRTCVRRERKVDLNWKAAVLCAPVAGESLNRPDESKLSSARFLLSPLVVLRTPCADLRSACHGGAAGGQGHSQFSSNRLSRHTQVLCYFPCTPRATALRQARVSGGNLQNCAPSAACGGAMAPRKNRFLRSSVPLVFRIITSSGPAGPARWGSGSIPCGIPC